MFFHTTPTDPEKPEPLKPEVIYREADRIPAGISWMHAIAKRGEANSYHTIGATVAVLGWDQEKFPVELGDAVTVVLRYEKKEEKG